jgi:hypothetical protein
MMKIKITFLIPLALLLSIGVNPAFAKKSYNREISSPVIDKLIAQGIASIHVTTQETEILVPDQSNSTKMKAKAKADSKVAKKERTQIRQAQKKQSKKINKKP